MAKPIARIRLVEIVFLLAVTAVVVRAGQLQIVEGGRWSREAASKRTIHDTMPARRGTIFDRNGAPLALTQEFYHLGIAPNEIIDRAELFRLVARNLGIPASRLQRDVRKGKSYLYYNGPFTAQQVDAIRSLRGVHLEAQYNRFYPALSLARPIIGGLQPDGKHGASGLEFALDSLLTGRPGERVLLRDLQGREYESPSRVVREPVPGYDVVLSLDNELQEIAENGLSDAIRSMHADGGDVVFYDPRNGELLAVASFKTEPNGSITARASGFTDPFEPGSTAKLFTAAALLMHGRVRETDAEFAENGVWMLPISSTEQRKITDAHVSRGSLTLAQAIEVSSNIVMAKFSARLSQEEHYDALRDFGFGSPTGVEYPSESRGRLARPDQWKPALSRASIAMGYEFGVTPVQLAAAYGAIANDGILLSPTLVREVRSPEGGVAYRRQPEPVRRAVTPEVATRLRQYLQGAVGEGGTGEKAQLANYTLMGKTGTAVRFEDGHYVKGEYTASFAAVFPADDPQLVVIVKIDNPQGDYYGGSTAGPLTRNMLQQALASRQVAIDRSRLMVREVATQTPPVAEEVVTHPVVSVSWPYRPVSTAANPRQPVPPVVGEPVRRGVAQLHRRGFQVILHGLGKIARISPASGDSVRFGATIVVWAE
ncbi:MAG: penicillin-binding protein 2 [Gemmatimonadota bacterium]